MSLQRPLSSSAVSILKFASTYVPRTCPHATRLRLSTKRRIVTTTEYRPTSLEPPFPPRNPVSAETSITGGVSQTSNPRAPPPKLEEQPQRSITEAEAQKTKHSEQPQASLSTETSSKPRKSKLRPRKAAITLTPGAISHLRNLLSQPEPKLIRVGVKNRGCSGLAYHLEFVDKPGAFDETIEVEGVKVLIDSKALFSIIGSEMDWVEDELKQRFIFRNPNIKEQCGCGESFMV